MKQPVQRPFLTGACNLPEKYAAPYLYQASTPWLYRGLLFSRLQQYRRQRILKYKIERKINPLIIVLSDQNHTLSIYISDAKICRMSSLLCSLKATSEGVIAEWVKVCFHSHRYNNHLKPPFISVTVTIIWSNCYEWERAISQNGRASLIYTKYVNTCKK
jgi:hypothetical protein